MYPGKTGGTYIIYNKFLKVFVLKHQTTIDNGIRKVSDKFDKGNNFCEFLYKNEIYRSLK